MQHPFVRKCRRTVRHSATSPALFGCLILLAALACGHQASAADCANADALGTSRVMSVSATTTPRVGLKHFPTTLPLVDKEVVLTFDDGPFPAITNRVLAALAKECVHATFFLIGRNALANPATVAKIVADGHTVAQHSFSHRLLNKIPEAAAWVEIDKGLAAIQQVMPEKTSVAPFFRFPGFASNARLMDELNAKGTTVFGADLWVSDWNPMTPQQELSQLTSRLSAAKRGIILMHDIHASTAAMLPGFLRYLKANGYKVVSVVPPAAESQAQQSPSDLSPTR
jgi:peptidoglycan/xylan/chitin deacetylase (PgdA/CDA1 family)